MLFSYICIKYYTDKNHGEQFGERTENLPQFSQNDNLFVQIGELFANFDKNILILRKLGKMFCLFLMIFSRFLSV